MVARGTRPVNVVRPRPRHGAHGFLGV